MPRLPYPATIAALDSLGLLVALGCSGLLGGAQTGWLFAADTAAVIAMFALTWLAIAIHMRVYRVAPEHNLSLAVRRSLEAWAATWGVAGIVALTTVAAHGFSVWF